MGGWLDSPWLLAAGYLVVAATAAVAGNCERQQTGASDRWPVFWFSAAACGVFVALGRLADLGELATRIGRSAFSAQGWYEGRRLLQAVAIGVFALSALIAPFVLAHIAGRRRRHVPALVALSALGSYAAVRMVSLHQVDRVLEGHRIGGVKVGTRTEYALLGLAVAVVVVVAFPRDSRRSRRATLRGDFMTSGSDPVL